MRKSIPITSVWKSLSLLIIMVTLLTLKELNAATSMIKNTMQFIYIKRKKRQQLFISIPAVLVAATIVKEAAITTTVAYHRVRIIHVGRWGLVPVDLPAGGGA